MRACVPCLLIILCTAPVAAQSKLDAPVSRQPTVGSEINRGQKAAFNCSMNTNVLSQTEFADCVSNTVTINRQRSTLSDPFEFGLYVRALEIANVRRMTPDTDGMVAVWHKRAADIMRSKKLTLADFCKAIGAGKCDLTQMREQTFDLEAARAK